jgi:hypothetical protein
MKAYLPSATQPWGKRIERRHDPKAGSYPRFRSCIRWEFGFSCAFCLLHEADLLLGGTVGWSIMQIEHSTARSKNAALEDVYTNCYYICERCNKSRGASPNQDDEKNDLLNPCDVSWADYFERVGDEIRPLADSGSARYTWECYDLDDPSKVKLRERRRIWVEAHAASILEVFRMEPALIDQVIESSEAGTAKELLALIDAAQGLRKALHLLLNNLRQFRPIPEDRDIPCQCRQGQDYSLPEVFAEQTVDLDDLLRQAGARRDRSGTRETLVP